MSKHLGGRPTDYNSKFCSELKKFFSKDRFTTIKTFITGKNEYSKEEEKRVACELPTFEKFAEIINVSRDTLYEWATKHKEFSDTMDYCRGIQKDFLIQNGLLGLYSPSFAIFVATNLTDMKNKQDVGLSGNVSNDSLSPEQRAKLDKLLND